MPKLLCRCDQVISFSAIPDEHSWWLISDVEFDSFVGMVDAEAVFRVGRHVLRCPQCGRLWVFWDKTSPPTEYIPQQRNS